MSNGEISSWFSHALPDYEITETIGSGAMGAVFAGSHRFLEREVAVKRIRGAIDNDSRERFEREARSMASLAHPHIVAIYDYKEVDGDGLIVMERCARSLGARLAEERVVTLEEACLITLSTLAGLSQAHERGLVHRDIKPDNLLYDSAGTLKVADFGIARGSNNATLTAQGLPIGTPQYMSPEQCRGAAEITPASDVYSVGVMAYLIMSGAHPFPGATTGAELIDAHLYRTPEPLADAGPEIPAALATVIHRALSKEVADRYTTALDFGAAIAGASNQLFGDRWLSRLPTDLHWPELQRSLSERVFPPPTEPAAPNASAATIVTPPPVCEPASDDHGDEPPEANDVEEHSHEIVEVVIGPGTGSSLDETFEIAPTDPIDKAGDSPVNESSDVFPETSDALPTSDASRRRPLLVASAIAFLVAVVAVVAVLVFSGDGPDADDGVADAGAGNAQTALEGAVWFEYIQRSLPTDGEDRLVGSFRGFDGETIDVVRTVLGVPTSEGSTTGEFRTACFDGDGAARDGAVMFRGTGRDSGRFFELEVVCLPDGFDAAAGCGVPPEPVPLPSRGSDPFLVDADFVQGDDFDEWLETIVLSRGQLQQVARFASDVSAFEADGCGG
ncbi:MAG: serine/threonine-protein kinase [Actinomycetota bacterium]